MASMDELPDIPDWGKQFVDDIRHHLLQLCGQSFDISIVEYALRRTFALAMAQVKGLSPEKRGEKITKTWMLQLAAEAFTRQLLHWLSIDPSLYFELFYYAFQHKVRACIMGLLKKAEDDPVVVECVQRTFIKIFRSLTSRATRGQALEYPFTGWLYKVAEGICLDYWEEIRHDPTTSLDEQEQKLEDERQQPDLYVEIKERDEKIQVCIERLPEPCRSCFRLYYFDDLPLKEIATRLGLSEEGVKNCIYGLAKRRFRKLWHEEYDE